MTRGARPAAYIRIPRDSGPFSLTSQRIAVREAARSRGWAEPAVYADADETGSAYARLTAAISTGQHDTLLIGVGTIRSLAGQMAALLTGCVRHGVAVECVTPTLSGRDGRDGRGGQRG